MWNTQITAINSKKDKWKLIFITGIFAFIFINIFEPFGIYDELGKNKFDIFLEISIALLSVIGTLTISQFFIRKALNINHFTYLTILFWFVFESALIGIVWTLLSILIDGNPTSFLTLWLTNVLECIFLIGLPYFTTIIYLTFKEKTKSVKQLQDKINKEKVNPETIISFKESSGKEKLKLRLNTLLFIESNDNYVNIYYLINQKINKTLLRNSIKNLEKQLQPYTIVRCHRSYMVNPINVLKKEKTSKGFYLFLKGNEKLIVPVSKSYSSEIEKLFR